ncbi:MAG: hypothetical protein NTW78_12525 [Campylobacterales bacterium]|nr:hypothetical protein [Campylobacterales bacterium]
MKNKISTKSLTIELTELEYYELLAKLANELEVYQDQASTDLETVFTKIYKSNLYQSEQTSLVQKFIKKLD